MVDRREPQPARKGIDLAEEKPMTDVASHFPLRAARVSTRAEAGYGRLLRRICRALGVLAAVVAAAAAIIGLRLLAYGLGHPDQPLFRDLSRAWG
jgi:hypothetical protein